MPITKDWAFAELFVPQAVRGVALMTCMLPVSILALGTLPPNRIKNASGLFNLMRNLGGAFGLAIITTILNKRTDLHLERLRETMTWSRQAVVEQLSNFTAGFNTTLGLDGSQAALTTLSNLVRQQALVMAFSDVFLLLAIVFFGGAAGAAGPQAAAGCPGSRRALIAGGAGAPGPTRTGTSCDNRF